MRFPAVFLLAAIALLAQTPTATIHGMVKDAATGEPLADFSIEARGAAKVPLNAIVMNLHQTGSNTKQMTIDADTGNTISDVEISPANTVYTGSDGKYTLTKVPAGKVTITAHNLRRDSVTKEVTLDAGDDAAVDFLIPPNPMASGRVLDSEKKPESGVKVWAVQSSWDDGITQYSLFGPRITDSSGAFLFEWGLTAGRKFYLIAERPRPDKLDPEKPIEAFTYYGNAAALDAATPMVLEPRENRGSLDIQILKSAHYCVEGTLAVSGKPARNPFEIRELAVAETGLARASGASDDQGKYRVCGLTPGQYRIVGKGPHSEGGTEDFVVGNSDVAHVDLFLDAVRLHLTAEWDGQPVSDPQISPGLAGKLAEIGVNAENFNRGLRQSVQVSLNGLGGSGIGALNLNLPPDGVWESHLAVGDYRVSVRPPACCYSKEVDFGGCGFRARCT